MLHQKKAHSAAPVEDYDCSKSRTKIGLSIDITVQKCYLHKYATKIHMSYIIGKHTSAGTSH